MLPAKHVPPVSLGIPIEKATSRKWDFIKEKSLLVGHSAADYWLWRWVFGCGCRWLMICVTLFCFYGTHFLDAFIFWSSFEFLARLSDRYSSVVLNLLTCFLFTVFKSLLHFSISLIMIWLTLVLFLIWVTLVLSFWITFNQLGDSFCFCDH